jgi:hypothetical protein
MIDSLTFSSFQLQKGYHPLHLVCCVVLEGLSEVFFFTNISILRCWQGYQPLGQRFVREERIRVIHSLLEYGASVNAQTHVRMLLSHLLSFLTLISIEQCGDTALYFASYNDDAEVVSLLLAFGADVNILNHVFSSSTHFLAPLFISAILAH